jgi:hexosaminidase
MMMGWDETEAGGIVSNMALMSWQSGSSYVLPAAESGKPVVMSPNNALYINYVETTTNIEPYFIVGGVPSYSSLSNVYSFEPIPAALPSQYSSNILGAQCNLWTEYVPSFENFMFKLYPRMCALAELTWSPTNSRSFTSFTNRLVTHEQRLAAMGVNYNHETIPQIGAWGSTVPMTPVTNSWDITPYVTAAGEYDVNFFRTNGANGLAISSVALLQNGAQVDIDVHNGLAQNGTSVYTLYIVHLPETKPGATYTIQAVYAGAGGTNTSGIVYLPNWN